MNKFEQLIEYVINDDTQKAQELFHEIVVEKSRQIYEDIMSEEEIDEADEGEDLEEGDMGGDAADQLIDNVEAEEQDDMNMEAAGDDEGADDMGDDEGADDMGGDDFGGGDMGGSDEAATKDDIMNLEDKLDQLMAEFEDLMGGDNDMGDGDGFGPDEGGDAIEMDDTEEMEPGMMESLDLKAAPKPVTSEEGGVNKKSTVAANAGAKGPIGNSVKPVRTGTDMGGHHDASPYKNTVKEIGTPSTQEAGKKAFKTAAPKPVTSQASGVNNRSITPGGRG
jgi:hypothetical protein